MSAFPGPGVEVYRNDEGEVLGWDYPSYEPEYCDVCGFAPCCCEEDE